MNFDIGEVLTRAWYITWRNKVLWVYGIAIGLMISLMFPLMFIPMLLPVLTENSRPSSLPILLFLGGYMLVFLLFIVAMYPVSALTQTSLTFGVLNFEQGDEKLPIVNMIKKGLPYFWRVLALMLLFAAGMSLIIFAVQGLVLLLTIFTLGFGAICAMPLTLLTYPAMYLTIVWMEQSMNAIVIDNMNVVDAARQGLNLIRNNLMNIGLMVVVIYFGVGMITAVALMPLMVPLFLMPIGFLGQQANGSILLISLIMMAAFGILFALICGWVMAFSKSAWVLTYLHLTRQANEPKPELQAVVA